MGGFLGARAEHKERNDGTQRLRSANFLELTSRGYQKNTGKPASQKIQNFFSRDNLERNDREKRRGYFGGTKARGLRGL